MSTLRYVEIRLTIPDNEARTALATLQRLGVPAAGLERADLYRCTLAEPGDERLREGFRNLETAFNPNKHALHVRDGERPLPGEVWVEELERDTRRTARPAGVLEVTRAVAWRLFDAAGTPSDAKVVRGATELLCNPAFQKATTS